MSEEENDNKILEKEILPKKKTYHPVLPFGKYKGLNVHSLNDVSYLMNLIIPNPRVRGPLLAHVGRRVTQLIKLYHISYIKKDGTKPNKKPRAKSKIYKYDDLFSLDFDAMIMSRDRTKIVAFPDRDFLFSFLTDILSLDLPEIKSLISKYNIQVIKKEGEPLKDWESSLDEG